MLVSSATYFITLHQQSYCTDPLLTDEAFLIGCLCVHVSLVNVILRVIQSPKKEKEKRNPIPSQQDASTRHNNSN
jgi:hypothetical protein